MSGTNTGLAAGFGGFAATPEGEMMYWNRRFNPYAFLQQDQTGLGATVPAAGEPMLARGGLAEMTPQQHAQWARMLNAHAGMHRHMAVQKLEDGGDAGGGDGGDGGDGGNGQAGASENGGYGGADATGNGPGGTTGMGGDGQATEVGGVASAAAGMNGMVGGMTTSGQPSSLGADPFGVSDEVAPSAAQMAFGMAKSGLGAVAPGFGLALGATGLTSAAANALGIGPMGPGATTVGQVGATVGGMLGGPAGAAIGFGIGAEAGAHGGNGNGMGGTGSNAGSGTSSDGTFAPPTSPGMDIGSLIQRIRASMGDGSSGHVQQASPGSTVLPGGTVQAFARGGTAAGGASHAHFHAGSGLVHSASDGRADAVQTSVPRGTYIVPADVVSGLGQGNTMAGAHKLGSMLRPVGHFASGGTVPVRLSGGEFVLHPAHVAHLGGGNLKAGSDKLDTMVGHVRRINAAQVARMPPPR